MATSPRSMWSGTVQLGLLNVPITIAKSWSESTASTTGLRDLCNDHKVPINRTERCGANLPCSMTKVKGVDNGDGEWRVLSTTEMAAIEDATKNDVLTVLAVQNTWELPMEYAIGTYFCRPDKNAKGAVKPFAMLAKALGKTNMGLVVKWCSKDRQKLAVLHNVEGRIHLTVLPFTSDIREPGEQETKHLDAEVSEQEVDMAVQLLVASRQEDFDISVYADEGLALRQEAVNRLLGGQKPEPVEQKPVLNVGSDLIATLKASLEQVKA